MLHRPLSNGMLVTDDQFAAACALAPYVHPKLTAMAVRDMTPDIGATQIEDPTPSIRLLLQHALGGELLLQQALPKAEDETTSEDDEALQT
jgi:hypothetical protein